MLTQDLQGESYFPLSTNFKLNFLSSLMAIMQNFSVYQMQNFLNFLKMVLLFIIALFFK